MTTIRPTLTANDKMRKRFASLRPEKVAPPPANLEPEALASAMQARLAELFPACFGKPERPLKVGIAQDIMARQPDLDVHAIRVALAAYCSKASYLAVIVEGAVRIDLDGNAAGTVDAGQAGYARKQLAKKRRLEANR